LLSTQSLLRGIRQASATIGITKLAGTLFG
jgi:hypothetical protein